MTDRPCLDCGTPSRRSRCPRHEALERDRRAANYGTAHQHQRDALLEALPLPCWYCGRAVTPDDFVAAHVRDGDPASPRVPAHRACNERAKRR